jgi:hypothetical protein
MGVGGEREKMPVYRLKVTEAHCFAEFLGGKLPTRQQWLRAAGYGQDGRPGPFNGDGSRVAVRLGAVGPWVVDKQDADYSIHGCHQAAGNGQEWTRTQQGGPEEVPLEWVVGSRTIEVCGKSYLATKPLLFDEIKSAVFDSNKGQYDLSFRVVLEPRSGR